MASLVMGAELPCCSWFTDAITPSYGLGANEPKLDGPNILPGRHAIYKVGNLSVSRKVQSQSIPGFFTRRSRLFRTTGAGVATLPLGFMC